jgi:hypothetical protein
MRGDCVNDNQKKFLTDFIDLMKRYNISAAYATEDNEIVFVSNEKRFKIRSYHNDSIGRGVTFVDTFGGE